MLLKFNCRILSLLLLSILLSLGSKAQEFENNLKETILELDDKFWQAYNACNLKTLEVFFTDDIEFYHDKSGLTQTLQVLMKQVSENVCGNRKMVLRREAIETSIEVYPLNNYGAIISGEHVFYLKEGDAKERLVEKAKFTHVWRLKKDRWQMSRVLSYNHQPISENSLKKEIQLSKDVLSRYIGNYQAPKTGLVKIYLSKEGKLTIKAGPMEAELHPEKENLFFIKEAPIVLEFEENTQGKITKFLVVENGTQVEEAIKIN